jgi:4-hydroxythreonine-4-phosphate dehydrogenase
MARERRARRFLAVSMGDPAGIGPEIILKTAAAVARSGARTPALVVIGDVETMREAAARLDRVPEPRQWRPGSRIPPPREAIAVRAISCLSAAARCPGHPTVEGGEASFRYVVEGARMAQAGEAAALVTAPISKLWWDRAGHHFPGHTELLAKIGRTRNWRMMFAGSRLRLVLVTVHLGLAKVAGEIKQKRVFDTIALLDRHLRENEGFRNPRIGVLGLNPHAGENGLFGDEEIKAIVPAIRRARRSGIDAFGPVVPDTAFIRPQGRFNFDAAVAMYHDQGLIALKTLEFDRAVNVTIGLPFIRTSPDHGTAFDIAGRGEASPSSMIAAVKYAATAARAREAAARRAH